MSQEKIGIRFLGVILIVEVMFSFFAEAQRATDHYVEITTPQGEMIGWYEGSYALLIGNFQYTNGWSQITAIPDEIQQVQDVLQEQGFKVRTFLNLNADQLNNAFEEFVKDYGYTENNRLLLFYSGHGATLDDEGYIVPTDAPQTRNREEFLQKALPMIQIVTWAKRIKAKHVLFLFDSCFSGTVFEARGQEDVPPYITRLTAEPVRMFITGGMAEERLPAKSTFTPFFVEGLRLCSADGDQDGYVTGMELGLYLQRTVSLYADHTPQYGKILDRDLDDGDFVFKLSPTCLTPTPSPTQTLAPTPTSVPSCIPLPEIFNPHGGFIPDGSGVAFTDQWRDYCYSSPMCIKTGFSATSSQRGFGGVYWYANNSEEGPGINLYVHLNIDERTRIRLTFMARGGEGGERVQFKVGGVMNGNDSIRFPIETAYLTLGTEWRRYEIDLSEEALPNGDNLSNVVGGFCWVTNEDQNSDKDEVWIFLDNICYEIE